MNNAAPRVIRDRKINIALVGCGRVANNHFHSIQQHQDRVLLTAVCDSDEKAMHTASMQYEVEGYNNIDEMLHSTNADLVALCTPSGMHSMQATKVAKSGRHVLTEKPMATSWQDGLKMVRECEQAGVHLFVVKQNRLNATLQLLKRAIEQHRFGQIYMANINVFWTRHQEYYDQSSWRGTWALDGGAFMNQASHYIDLLHWLLGPIDSVQAMTGTLARRIEAEDTGVINVRWRNGAIGSVSVTMLTYPKNYEGSITILGEKGTVRIGGIAANEIQCWEFADDHPDDEQIKNANYQTTSVYGFGHPIYYDNVMNCIQGKALPLVNGKEGLASLELLIAAYRAAQSQATVYLPLEVSYDLSST